MSKTTKRYFLFISYQGTAYHGWQIQPRLDTVQGMLTKAFARVYGPVHIVGSSRTDTGVHAHRQVAHLDLQVNDVQGLHRRIQVVLPKDIAIHRIVEVPPESHARYDAVCRSYIYHITRTKNPFIRDTSYYFPYPLHLHKMNDAAALLLGRHNFASFCKKKSAVAHHYCNLTKAFWSKSDNQYIFHITANRFLHGMVRSIVGTLLSVGREKMDEKELKKILEAQNRCQAGKAIPAHGLVLTDVHYPTTIVPSTYLSMDNE